MNKLRMHSVLKSFHITEKATTSQGDRALYIFKVLKNATKLEIKEAVESLFEVKVARVCTVNKKPVVKRFRQTVGRRAGMKKAYVLLQAGQLIDVESASA
jgi:large subunit ribosomal protein L23